MDGRDVVGVCVGRGWDVGMVDCEVTNMNRRSAVKRSMLLMFGMTLRKMDVLKIGVLVLEVSSLA